MNCLFVSDLHGDTTRYRKLLAALREIKPDLLFIGGDIMPGGLRLEENQPEIEENFIRSFLIREFQLLRDEMGDAYPRIFIILGNDDHTLDEQDLLAGEQLGLWEYAHNRRLVAGKYVVYGYNFVPPTPFLHKDWERYDVSRYLDPGDVSPENGWRTVEVSAHEKRYSTIAKDLDNLVTDADLTNAVFLFHAPPHDTKLDRCNNDGKMVDHVPLDLHVGSIAISRLIKRSQPLVTLHGHIHESARLSGSWIDSIGRTTMIGAAHDGPELALIRFDLEKPEDAVRGLV